MELNFNLLNDTVNNLHKVVLKNCKNVKIYVESIDCNGMCYYDPEKCQYIIKINTHVQDDNYIVSHELLHLLIAVENIIPSFSACHNESIFGTKYISYFLNDFATHKFIHECQTKLGITDENKIKQRIINDISNMDIEDLNSRSFILNTLPEYIMQYTEYSTEILNNLSLDLTIHLKYLKELFKYIPDQGLYQPSKLRSIHVHQINTILNQRLNPYIDEQLITRVKKELVVFPVVSEEMKLDSAKSHFAIKQLNQNKYYYITKNDGLRCSFPFYISNKQMGNTNAWLENDSVMEFLDHAKLLYINEHKDGKWEYINYPK